MKLKIREARQIYQAAMSITSGTHMIATRHDKGEFTTTQIPYELDDKARWNLIKNATLLERAIKVADKCAEAISRECEQKNGGALPTRATNPQLFAEYLTRMETLEDREEAMPLLRVKRSGLREGENHGIPGVVLAALFPVLVDDVSVDESGEVIAD